MEPCTTRLSGKQSCTDRCLLLNIKRVVIGTLEPSVFVSDCIGVSKLRDSGIKVVVMEGLENECLEMNLHLL